MGRSYPSDRHSFCGKRPLAIAATNVELPPFKNGEHNSESASTIDHGVTPLKGIPFVAIKILSRCLRVPECPFIVFYRIIHFYRIITLGTGLTARSRTINAPLVFSLVELSDSLDPSSN